MVLKSHKTILPDWIAAKIFKNRNAYERKQGPLLLCFYPVYRQANGRHLEDGRQHIGAPIDARMGYCDDICQQQRCENQAEPAWQPAAPEAQKTPNCQQQQDEHGSPDGKSVGIKGQNCVQARIDQGLQRSQIGRLQNDRNAVDSIIDTSSYRAVIEELGSRRHEQDFILVDPGHIDLPEPDNCEEESEYQCDQRPVSRR